MAIFIELLLIGVGLSMDAFAVSICKGLAMRRVNKKQAFVIGLFFGGFQALMPFIGWALGTQFESYITSIDHWIAFVLLAFIGGKMIAEAVRSEDENVEIDKMDPPLDLKEMFVLAVATSIDALAVGITFAFLNYPIGEAVTIIGLTTFCISIGGIYVGNFFGNRYKKKAEIAGGIILVLITLFVVLNLINSRTGRAIMSIRDNRIAAESIGINITKYKLLAFSISAALAGVAGVLYAHNLTTLTALPKNFGYNMSIMILVYVVLGGIGSIRGSVISTVILYLLPELLRGLNNYRMLIYAIVLILAMLFNSAPQFITLRKRIFSGLKPQHAAHSGKEEA